jgi:hypothetical protein
MKIVAWFSCGAASAVMCKLLLTRRQPGQRIEIVRISLPNDEHSDNERFAGECEAWFGQVIQHHSSSEYPGGCFDVWSKRRYMAGVAGAVCTTELKKAVRHRFEQEWHPDYQAFGYTAEERPRAERFRANNPDVRLLTPLIEAGLSKQDCLAMLNRAGIAIPAMYRLGFNNNNCIGCVKAQAPAYWNRVRRHFPERFARIAALADELGAKLVRVGDERVALSALDPDAGQGDAEPEMDCSLLCAMAEHEIAERGA